MSTHLKPNEVLKYAASIGEAKVNSNIRKLFILGFLAGAFIAFGAAGSNMAAMNLLDNPKLFGLGRALAGLLFTPGLMLVILAGGELFTGDILIAVSVLEKKVKLSKMTKLLFVVYAANLAGGISVAWAMNASGIFSSGGGLLGEMTVKIAAAKTSISFSKAVLLGIMCNWLVCLAVWMSFAAQETSGKILSIFFPIWLFVTSGYEHSVANMYYIPAGIFAKTLYAQNYSMPVETLTTLDWRGFFIGNLLPVTIGNILGGALFVSLAYWMAFSGTKKL